MGMPVHEIHSRKSQTARERVSKQFKNETNTVMFSSDVSARGMDYPDVTQVIQVGAPMSKEQYIHRLGRTARAGKSGECMLLLTPHEDSFLRTIRDLPVKHLQFERDDNVAMAAAEGARRVDPKTGAQCYQAFLGYYNGCNFARMPKPQLVQMANHWAACMGLPGPPRLEKKTVGKMGLKGVAGLNV
jgi:ATP-dependent RNA helicase MSS116